MLEQGKIPEALDVSLENIFEAAFVSKKCFMADRGYGGTVSHLEKVLLFKLMRRNLLPSWIVSSQ